MRKERRHSPKKSPRRLKPRKITRVSPLTWSRSTA